MEEFSWRQKKPVSLVSIMAAEQPSITGAMLQRAKGPELVSYLKVPEMRHQPTCSTREREHLGHTLPADTMTLGMPRFCFHSEHEP